LALKLAQELNLRQFLSFERDGRGESWNFRINSPSFIHIWDSVTIYSIYLTFYYENVCQISTYLDKGKPGESQRRKAIGAFAANHRCMPASYRRNG
jgi:hypothetical protein